MDRFQDGNARLTRGVVRVRWGALDGRDDGAAAVIVAPPPPAPAPLGWRLDDDVRSEAGLPRRRGLLPPLLLLTRRASNALGTATQSTHKERTHSAMRPPPPARGLAPLPVHRPRAAPAPAPAPPPRLELREPRELAEPACRVPTLNGQTAALLRCRG
jgi:hypothetical protein